MSVRVNLLKPQEIQQQSAVSRSFMRRGATTLGVGLAMLGVAVVGWQYYQSQVTYQRLKARWAAMEIEYSAVKQISDDHDANMKYVAELDGWGRSRVTWEAPMNAIQALVPDNLQFLSLAVSSEVVISAQEPATKEYAGTPARVYTFRIEGRAVGSMSDQDVIAFVETIRESSQFSPWLKWVRLQGMQRAPSTADMAEEIRNFRVNGSAEERMMK